MTRKAPFPDAVEGPNANKEEEQPACIGRHYRRIRIVYGVHEVRQKYVACDSSYHAEDDPGYPAGEKTL